MPKFRVLIILALGSVLSSCGGGSGTPAPTDSVVSNQAPTANAGVDQSVDEGVTVELSGSGADSDGNIVSYEWQQVGGIAVTITDVHLPTASFVAPAVSASEILLFRLTVTDNDGATGSDTVEVTVNDVLPPPPVTGQMVWDESNWDEVNWQ